MKASKWIFVLLATAFVLGAASCSRKEEAKPETKMSADLEMQHLIDVGTILDTTAPLELFIPVKNRSNRTVTILRLTKDCACTSVTIDKTKLAPGETAKVRLSSNLSGKSLMFISQIVLESDAVEKVDEIQIQGKITGQIRVRPARAVISMSLKDAPGSFTVFCDNQDGKWEYQGFTADDPNLKIDLQLKAQSPTTATYAGTVSLPPATRGKYPDYSNSAVRLEFEHGRLGRKLEVVVPVDLVVRRALTADPPQVTFMGTAGGQKRTVVVQSGDALRVDAATCESPCVRPSLRWVDKKTLLVDLAFDPAQFAASAPKELSCRLQADGKMVASIPINIVTLP